MLILGFSCVSSVLVIKYLLLTEVFLIKPLIICLDSPGKIAGTEIKLVA